MHLYTICILRARKIKSSCLSSQLPADRVNRRFFVLRLNQLWITDVSVTLQVA
ncbi:hypothetical protein SAMN05428978_102723 [Nitrosomonas sp. Nm34]|nr:hypothetical protein SAMN05428978_102723 [Nitrosomonas sp. Nm34]